MAKTPVPCAVSECNRTAKGKGLCSIHYHRMRRHGDPTAGGISSGSHVRYLQDVALPCTSEECLLWPFKAKAGAGYGKMRIDGKQKLVHRVVCELAYGKPPSPRHEAAHLCGKGHLGCVNPMHLAWKTPKENKADTLVHGTRNRGENRWSAKLTENDVRDIRRLRETKSLQELMSMFGISHSQVLRIVKRQSWAWLE